MFSKLFNKNNDVLDYSELVPYFRKEEISLFINDPNFKNKYKKHAPTINAFIHEVRKNKKAVETIEIINKYIINLETPKMLKIIYLYIDNSEEDRKDFFAIIDKKYNLDSDDYSVQQQIEIDQTYNRVKTGRETFNDIALDDLYSTLDYPEKEYLNNILSIEGGFDTLKFLFNDRYRASFKLLLRLLNKRSVDHIILNKDVLDNLGNDYYRELVLTLVSNENGEIAKYVKMLIANHRYDLIKDMIDMNLMGDVVSINVNNKELTDEVLIKSIETLKARTLINN